MQDISIIAVFFAACTAAGLPPCLLLPPDRFRARFIAAPPIGLALLSVATTVGYLHGIAPAHSAAAVAALGLSIAGAVPWRRSGNPDGTATAVAAAAIVVAFLCLLPAWTGGVQFSIFQGNAYDQFNSYLNGSIGFRHHDHASLVAAAARDGRDSIMNGALSHFNNRGAVSIVHVAIAQLSRSDTIASSYPYIAALQMTMFFSAVFVALNVFAADRAVALLAAAALTLGFFEQNILDFNAWSQLSTQPLTLLFIGVVALAFEPDRFGRNRWHAGLRIGLVSASLAAGILYLYPEALAIYGVAAAVVVIAALTTWPRSDATRTAIAGLCLGAGLSFLAAVLFWDGTVAYFFRQIARNAFPQADWWTYYHRHLLGAEENYVSYLMTLPPLRQAWFAIFSIPVDALTGALGLHYLLPSAGWPRSLALVWKLALYGVLAILVAGIARCIVRVWREDARGARLMLVASAASLVVPAGLFFKSAYWAAGKGLTMASPLLFFVAILPLFVGGAPRLARCLSLLLVGAHLGLGLLRPVMAADPSGNALAGLALRPLDQKQNLDWNHLRWREELRGCREVALDIEEPVMQIFARLVLTDIEVLWSARDMQYFGGRRLTPHREAAWAKADCLLTTRLAADDPERKVVRLNTDTGLADFLAGRRNEIELAAQNHSGLRMDGFYTLEKTSFGRLRWSSPEARLEIANVPGAPARTLILSLWPMRPARDARLQIAVNGQILHDDLVPAGRIELPLDAFANATRLAMTFRTDPALHYPADQRELGVAWKELTLRR